MTTERAYFGYENRLEEKLRKRHEHYERPWRVLADYEAERNEAADEIERLRSLNAELVAALEEVIERVEYRKDAGFAIAEGVVDRTRAALAKVKAGK